jgi:membrane protein YqaA with SNARE-associated domain
MNFEELVGKVGVYAASFVVGFVSGLVPFVNSELYLIAVSPMVARPALLPIALLSAAGQLTAKTIIFYAGRGVFKINMGRLEQKIEKVQKKFQQWEREKKTDLLMLISATTGYPPFYVLSFVAGAVKLHYIRFLTIGIIGRSIRFTAIVYFPQLVLKYI